MVDIHGYYFIIPLLIYLISIIFLRSYHAPSDCKSRHLPTPFALPIIGHLHLLSSIPHQALHRLSTQYGPVFRFFLGSVPCVAVSSPEMAKEFLRTHETSFLDRPRNTTTVYLTYGSKDFMFAPYGTYWKFMKKLIMSELLNGRTLDLLLPVRRDEINRFMTMLSQKAKLGMHVDLKDELFKLTNNVISRMMVNGRCSEEEKEEVNMKKLVTEISEISGRFNLADYIWFCKNLDLQGFGRRLKEIHPLYDKLIERIISEHEEERRKKKDKEEVNDLLDILLNVSEDDSMEMKVSRENIKAFILVIF